MSDWCDHINQEEDFLPHTMGMKLDAPPKDGAAPTVSSLTAAEERLSTTQRVASSSQASASDENACRDALMGRLRFRRLLVQVMHLYLANGPSY